MIKRRVVLGCLPQMVSAIKAVLENSGYEVAVVTNGKEVKESIGHSPYPSAYVVDVDLPTWWNSGMDAIMMIRRSYSVPVVYITKIGGPSLCVSRTEETGMVIRHDYSLEKSEMDELLKILADLIDRHEHTIPACDWD